VVVQARSGFIIGLLSLLVLTVEVIWGPGTRDAALAVISLWAASLLVGGFFCALRARKWLGFHYAQLEDWDRNRVRRARHDSIKVADDGVVEQWRLSDGSEHTHVRGIASYKALAVAGRVDPRVSSFGSAKRAAPVPDGWLARWKVRREAQRSDQSIAVPVWRRVMRRHAK